MAKLIVSDMALEVIQEALDQQTQMEGWDRSEWPADEARHYKALNSNRVRILQTIRDLINTHGGDAYSMILDLMQDLTAWDSNSIQTLLRHFAPKASSFKWRLLDSNICFVSYPPEPSDLQPTYRRNERSKPYEFRAVWLDISSTIDQLYQTQFNVERGVSRLIFVHWYDLCELYEPDDADIPLPDSDTAITVSDKTYVLPNSKKTVTVSNETYVVPRNLAMLRSIISTRVRLVILHTQIHTEPLKQILRAAMRDADVGFCRPTLDGSAFKPEYFADFVQTPQEPSVVRAIEQHITKYGAKFVEYVGSAEHINITTDVCSTLNRLRSNPDPAALEDFAIYEV